MTACYSHEMIGCCGRVERISYVELRLQWYVCQLMRCRDGRHNIHAEILIRLLHNNFDHNRSRAPCFRNARSVLLQSLRHHPLHQLLRTLPGLLGTDHGDDPAQLGALGCVLLDHLLLHAISLGEVGRGLQHPVLKHQHLLQCVVKEWC